MDALKYVLKKLWALILLLCLSAVAVLGGFSGWPLYGLLESYFYFALFVIAAGIVVHFICEALPRKFAVDKGLFACHPFEDGGKIYDRIFKVGSWKDKVMDASKVFTATTKGKSAAGLRDPKAVGGIIQETCVAEISHLILIAASPIILIICKNVWKWLLFPIYVLFNLADIVIQRFNRPRFVKLYERMLRRNEGTAS